jgi:predicted N-acetyltransferase YhbS
MVTTWEGEKLVGIARSITDFHYTCYLADLAVHKNDRRKGIGKKMQSTTQNQLCPKCKLILVAAPAAHSYYEHVGFTKNPRCWILDRAKSIRA